MQQKDESISRPVLRNHILQPEAGMKARSSRHGNPSPLFKQEIQAYALHPYILSGMQMTASPPETRSNSGFATLLASLASSSNVSTTGWDNTALAEDVATLSYEKALKTHTRRSGYPEQRLTDFEESGGNSFQGLGQEPRPATQETAELNPKLPVNVSRPSDERAHRKSASVTIRLGELENEQLHARAAEAGLSVSAYLRSCIFEVEELRSQVKQTLADMRKSNPRDQDSSLRTVPHPSRGWRERILPRWSRHREVDTV